MGGRTYNWISPGIENAMPFRFHFLVLLELSAPFIIAFVTYSVCRKFGQRAELRSESAKKITPARQTYFYPTRDIGGNWPGL
jgi:hypothetical protein